jgi:hypothetical protein
MRSPDVLGSESPSAKLSRGPHQTPGGPEEQYLPIHLRANWKPRYTLPRLQSKMAQIEKSKSTK